MDTQTYHIRIGDGRRFVLPSELCRSMDLDVGDTMVVRVERDYVVLSSVEHTIDRFQSLLAATIPAGVSLVDELIADRERMASHE
jgi:bifunctional DNA-binding transcriptional regulator/antitoxin component of YhaV-PrlF toxin-antitoxin module